MAANLTANNACGIPGSVADAGTRIISNHVIDIGFNNPAAVAVWPNNR